MKQSTKELPTLIDTDEVARILNLKPKTIRMYCLNRKIPFVKICGAVRFDVNEIAKWVESSKVKAIR